MFEKTTANATIDAYLTNLRQLTEGMTQLKCVVERMVQSLQRRGIGVMVDLDGMMQGIDCNLREMSSSSHAMTVQLEQLQALTQVSALLVSDNDPDQKLKQLLDIIIDFSGAERAYILLLNDGELTVRSACNWEGEVMLPQAVVYSENVVRKMLASGQPIVTLDAQSDKDYNQYESIIANGLRSIICLPLKLHGEIIGLLYADNRIDKGKFTDDSIRLLAPLADQAAGAIALERATGYSASAAAPSLATIDRNGAQRTPRRYEFLPIAEWPEHPTATGFSDLSD